MSGEVPAVVAQEEAGVSPDPIDDGHGSGDAATPSGASPKRRRGRAGRAASRLAALLALAAVGAAVALIITSTLHHGAATSTSAPATKVVIARHHVLAGDSLATIAARFHTSVASLEQLNPSINPDALVPGQVLRVSVTRTANQG